MGRLSRRYSQAERLERMLRILASRAVTINELASEFHLSRRQVYRDLCRIEEVGHPLTQNTDAGERTWQLPLGYQGIPPITVSPYELMSLHLAKSHLAYLARTPFTEDLERLIKKIEANLPAKTINHLERILRVFAPVQRPTRSYAKHQAVLTDLRKSLLLQRTAILHHQKPGYDEPVQHRVDPYGLLLYQYGLYLVGFSHRAEAHRLFAVERISKVDLTDAPFDIPQEFSLEESFRRLFGIVDEPPLTVRIRFAPEVAYLLQERQWHPTQTLRRLKDGAVIVTLKAGGLEELTSWVLSFGAHAKVLGPPALVASVTDQIAAAQENYPSQFSQKLSN